MKGKKTSQKLPKKVSNSESPAPIEQKGIDRRRLMITMLLAMITVLLWERAFVTPTKEHNEQAGTPSGIVIEEKVSSPNVGQDGEVKPSLEAIAGAILERQDVIKQGFVQHRRIALNNEHIKGSINLVGARVDDLELVDYKRTLNNEEPVVLLSPYGSKSAYFAEFGWVSPDKNIDLPDSKTIWTADKPALKADDKLTLSWTNRQGLTFNLVISLDDRYMFNVKQIVKNSSGSEVTLGHYSLLNRKHLREEPKNIIIHEGAIGVFDNKLAEVEYEDLAEKGAVEYSKQKGWAGFSDKYWLTALIPSKEGPLLNYRLARTLSNNIERFQVDNLTEISKVASGSVINNEVNFFAGAKQLDLLQKYEQQYNIPLFDHAVDFGFLYFITKPIFKLLSACYNVVGNFGIAILVLTVLIKILLFPLAYKGFKGMNKMKELQPLMTQLKEKHKDDPQAFQQALMELYKKHNANPFAGCLPLLLQMPVFFALYKVLYVTIEMRHAPFFGWVKDLTAPDPTNIFNLFGVIPWDPPAVLHIGFFPILMAITMYLQQRMSPEPADPIQAKVMRLMPLLFLFMFASFPAGLVIYWSWSNILSVGQQFLIKKFSK
jgi:YidC/Oxa1 family membrane protein insertase